MSYNSDAFGGLQGVLTLLKVEWPPCESNKAVIANYRLLCGNHFAFALEAFSILISENQITIELEALSAMCWIVRKRQLVKIIK